MGHVDNLISNFLFQTLLRCYSRALKILPKSSQLWHDLGLSFFFLCKETSDEDEAKVLINKCMHAVKNAISLEPNNYLHWNALGVVCASHCESK